jgi:hypothetical protein
MIVGGDVKVADHVLPLKLHVHGPSIEVDFSAVGGSRGVMRTTDQSFLGRTTSFIARALLEVGLVLEHHLLTRDLHRFASVCRVAIHASVWVRDWDAGRCRRGLRWSKADIWKSTNGFALTSLAGNFHIIGIDFVGHQLLATLPAFITKATR